ncbi:MAG: hypothetical protein M1282_17655, partial [Chloroflexi bacterium]|nr:hypothetical protein [Chloroflexota bacterium]
QCSHRADYHRGNHPREQGVRNKRCKDQKGKLRLVTHDINPHMALHNPPEYRYSLFTLWDRKAFKLLKKIGKRRRFPRLVGDPEIRDKFLRALIRSQKSLHGWRGFLKAVLLEIEKAGAVDMSLLVKKLYEINLPFFQNLQVLVLGMDLVK